MDSLLFLFLGVIRETVHRNAKVSAAVDAIQRTLNRAKDWDGGRKNKMHAGTQRKCERKKA